MNIFRPQKPYTFCPPKYAAWFRPVLHGLTALFLRYRFNIRDVQVRGQERLVELVKSGQSVLVAPNHADHADPALLVTVGRRHGLAFHFMAAREGFERGWLSRFVLQHSGAFSVDREGADLASIRTAMNLLRECRHPLVIFPEGEIWHHHEELDLLNEGVATILLRAAEKLPDGKRSYAVPTAIHITHVPSEAATFLRRLDALEQRITWKPKSQLEVVDRIYRLGGALLSIKEEEFMGEAQKGDLVGRIQKLQQHLIQQIERKHGRSGADQPVPLRLKALRHVIRQELNAATSPPPERQEELCEELEQLFVAQQLYSYPGQYLRRSPTLDRIAETIFKLEEDVLEHEHYPAPRRAEVIFGEPIDVFEELQARNLNARSAVQPMTELLRERIQTLSATPAS
jgi:1-acyl-sn-glycerol-3-phosphate acyltransferase